MATETMRLLEKAALLAAILSVSALVTGETAADQALDACGLPTGYAPVSHCFNDVTHHTCCLLGPEARAYADSSGNPIGEAAVKAWEAKTGSVPAASDLTPWCTCFGSLVCSYYASRFNDGTTIKFVNEPGSNPPEGAFDVPSNQDCEAKVRDYFKVQAHGTPGVSDEGAESGGCPNSVYAVPDHIHPLSTALASEHAQKLVHRDARDGEGWTDVKIEEHTQ